MQRRPLEADRKAMETTDTQLLTQKNEGKIITDKKHEKLDYKTLEISVAFR